MVKSATERAEAQQWAERVQYLENEVERLKDLLKCSSEKECMHLRAEIERLRSKP